MTHRETSRHRWKPGRALLWLVTHWQLLVAAALVVAALWAYRQCRTGQTSIGVVHNRAIDTTPEEIHALRDIGQWETLTVSTEELVDTFATDWRGTRQLVRIYAGTLRLGVDLGEAADDWFHAAGDTAYVRLPRVKLLDDRFIDEARSRSFYERGRWDADTREQLYERARRAMVRRCLTPANLTAAEQSAREQFSALMRGLGYTTTLITFENQ